jgi:hypothetical protein
MALNANALVSLATTKDHMEIPSANTSQDIRLERLINTASTMIENQCSRKLKQTTVTEYQDGRGSDRILLREYPASKPSALYIDNDWAWGADTLIDSTSYDILNDSEVILASGLYFRSGRRNIKITYQAGFSTIPDDLVQAALMLVEYMYAATNDRRIGVSSKSKNGEQVYFKDGIPQFVLAMLEPYERCDFPLNVSGENIK